MRKKQSLRSKIALAVLDSVTGKESRRRIKRYMIEKSRMNNAEVRRVFRLSDIEIEDEGFSDQNQERINLTLSGNEEKLFKFAEREFSGLFAKPVNFFDDNQTMESASHWIWQRYLNPALDDIESQYRLARKHGYNAPPNADHLRKRLDQLQKQAFYERMARNRQNLSATDIAK
jgi:hypothetical protein